jgi:hypothetical protein
VVVGIWRERGVCVRVVGLGGVSVDGGVDHNLNGCQTMLDMGSYHRW